MLTPALARTLALEIGLYPGVWVVHDNLERVADHPAVDDDAYPPAGAIDGVQIVRDHHYGELQFALQVNHQIVECRCTDRVQAGSRLVEEQQQWIERERARQRRALDHATGKLRWILACGLGRQPDQLHPEQGELIERSRCETQVLEHRQLYVLTHIERAE